MNLKKGINSQPQILRTCGHLFLLFHFVLFQKAHSDTRETAAPCSKDLRLLISPKNSYKVFVKNILKFRRCLFLSVVLLTYLLQFLVWWVVLNKYFRSKKIQKWHCFMSVARNVFVKKVENEKFWFYLNLSFNYIRKLIYSNIRKFCIFFCCCCCCCCCCGFCCCI